MKIVYRILKVLGCIAAIFVILFAWNLYSINHISINEYDVYSPKLPNSFNQYKIALISDFHDASYYEKLISAVKQQQPDIILLAGDMVNIGDDSYKNTLSLLDGLKDTAPMYMVTGNHEMYHDKLEQIKNDFAGCGVKLLNNKSEKIYKDSEYISLYGCNDPAVSDSELTEKDNIKALLKSAENGIDVTTFSFMLMHRANMFDLTYDLGYDLILSGHIHGGVVRLPGIGGVLSPERDTWFPTYTKGMYFLGQSRMIVSAGLDKQKEKPRIFNPPELVMVNLKRG